MAQKHTILLVDDDKNILEFLGYNLRHEGFEVLTTDNGPDAIKIAMKNKPDLVVLDILMPKMDGIAVCNHLRQKEQLTNTRIAFLSALGDDRSQLAGFEAGGDDYILKPVHPKVLISRIRSLLGRKSIPDKPGNDVLHIANIIVDREKYLVFKDGQEITLPRKEFEILYLLASRANKVFTRQEIFEKIWGGSLGISLRTIDVHMRKLREKVDIPNIVTVKGVGYKIDSRVSVLL